MRLDGLPLNSQGLHALRLWAALASVQAWCQEWLPHAGKPAASRLGELPRSLPTAGTVPSNIAAAGQLSRSLELLERLLNADTKAPETTFSAPADSPNNISAPVPRELEQHRQTNLRFVLLGPVRPLSPTIRDDVYRIGRAALENAFNHSRATRVEVEFEYAANRFRMVVRDDGRGMDQRQLRPWREGHRGLSSMAELAGKIGATLTLWSRTASGTELELSVPNQTALEV